MIALYCLVVSVGFDEESYTCSESKQEECQLCVSILSPDEIDPMLYISLQATSMPVSAEGKLTKICLSFSYTLTMLLQLKILQKRMSFCCCLARPKQHVSL